MRAVLLFLQPELTGMRVDIFGDNEGVKSIADNRSSSILFDGGKFVLWERRSNMPMSSRNPYGERSFCMHRAALMDPS